MTSQHDMERMANKLPNHENGKNKKKCNKDL